MRGTHTSNVKPGLAAAKSPVLLGQNIAIIAEVRLVRAELF